MKSLFAIISTVVIVLASFPMSENPVFAEGSLGQIAFSSTRDGNTEIYIMNADGTGQTNLTNNPATDGAPSLSRDGAKIAFSSNRNTMLYGYNEVLIMNPDGSKSVSLVPSLIGGTPSWSPDGSKIAFQRSYLRDSIDIGVLNADGSNLVWLTTDNINDTRTTWSPDGTKIAFAKGTGNNSGVSNIWVMDNDGTTSMNLTNDPSYNNQAPAWSPDGTKIAFGSNRNDINNFEIYLMDADGKNSVRLTNSPGYDSWPAWSPDGTRIAFQSSRDGNGEIYVMDVNGNNQTRLTFASGTDSAPTWSLITPFPPLPPPAPAPITGDIAFFSERDGNREIYVMNADGTGQINLTNSRMWSESGPKWSPDRTKIAYYSGPLIGTTGGGIWIMPLDGINPPTYLTGGGSVAWSPDGNKIAFHKKHSPGGLNNIWVMNTDGTNPIELTYEIGEMIEDREPVWSPDGTKIAFQRGTQPAGIPGVTPIGDIWVMNADGSNKVNLTNNESEENRAPGWSPDGTKIAFGSNRTGIFEVFVMNSDGSDPVNITNNSVWNSWPAWSPDGSQIVFQSARDGNAEIYAMNADGTNQVRLTNSPGIDSTPAWAPLKIVNRSPVIQSVIVNPATLWPPNKKPVNVTITVDASDPDGVLDITGTTYSVVDEYRLLDVTETILPKNGIISLIADRDGQDKDGRVYTITICVYDAGGLSDKRDVVVVVPHDHSKEK